MDDLTAANVSIQPVMQLRLDIEQNKTQDTQGNMCFGVGHISNHRIYIQKKLGNWAFVFEAKKLLNKLLEGLMFKFRIIYSLI